MIIVDPADPENPVIEFNLSECSGMYSPRYSSSCGWKYASILYLFSIFLRRKILLSIIFKFFPIFLFATIYNHSLYRSRDVQLLNFLSETRLKPRLLYLYSTGFQSLAKSPDNIK